MIHSKKFSINWADCIHGFVTAFITASSVGIMSMLNTGTLPTVADIRTQSAIGLAGGFAYLIKKFISNSDNRILSKEKSTKIE